MKTKYLSVLLLLLVCTCVLAFRLADDPFEALLKKLSNYNEAHPQEKVYLHLDKPYYAIGDNIWFKAYTTDNRTNALSLISHILYVELIDEDDSLKKQIKLPLISGITWGDFKLPDTLQEGNYRIRAYTEWMRNAGPDFFYDKTIKIGNAWSNRVFTSTTYSFTQKDKIENVNALLKFKDKQGEPYGGRAVTYEIKLSDKITGHGKGVTNTQGEINFSFSNNKPNTPVSGKITATLTLQDKQQVVKTIPIKATSNAVSVQLFPESGNLVDNLPSKVGIKAINASGLGEDVSGTVIDNDGTELTAFTTTHLGMGSFMVSPEPGKSYTARIKQKDGTIQNVPLPKAMTTGYVLTINDTDSTKLFGKVLISEKLLNQGDIKLVIQQNNSVYAVIKTTTAKQVTSFTLPKKDLPSGILHFTLFTPGNLPIAERLIFVNKAADQIQTNVTNLKPVYGKREKVELEFLAKDGDKPTEGSFSIAVTNTAIVEPDEDNESNILSNLLLTSDLKGYIEKPNYYFRNRDEQTRENLDNLMLTQGWSRLLWKDIMGEIAKAPVFPAEKSLKVSGIITTFGGKPVANGKVSLMNMAKGLFMIDTLTDAAGHFTFDNLSFGDSTKFIVQARNIKNKKNVDIKLDIIPGQVITKNKNTGDIEVNVNESIKNYVQKSEGYFNELTNHGLLAHSHLLNQVNIVEKKKPAIVSSNLNGAGNADNVIMAKDLGTCINISDCLQGKVAGMMISNGRASLMRNMGKPMEVIVDGVPMIDMGPPSAGPLNDIQPFDVETIEILKSGGNTAIYGSQGSNGVIIITTKRGGNDPNYHPYTPGIITYSPMGYYAERQFYSPQYTPDHKDEGTDQRTTVYWNPHVPTTAAGLGKFNFYNTDQSGVYRVVIEGINSDGHLARKVYTYEVK